MIVLGINGGVRAGYMDAAAALVIDGKVVAAVEEERLNRIKKSPGQIPELSIRAVLKKANISIKEVDYVGSHGITWGNEYKKILMDFFVNRFGHCPKLEIVHHHDAHAASAFYASGFEEAMVITLDNSGDGISTQLAIGKGTSIEIVERYPRPNSLGIYYSMFTQFCGFRREYDEYKLMGLSSYGDRSKYDFNWLLSFEKGKYDFNLEYLVPHKPGYPSPSRQQMLFNEKFINKLGSKRFNDEPVTSFYQDIAASAQKHIEDALVHLVNHFNKQTGISRLCLAGGVALNSAASQKLMNLDCLNDIYIQPAAGDAGVSLGAAYLVSSKYGDQPQPISNVYLGDEFTNSEIEGILKTTNLTYRKIDDPASFAAKMVGENKIVGWFQGRTEYGPRALGNRSIFANPTVKGINNKINDKVKFRESFRPFCPSVLEEDAHLFF